MNNPPYNVSVTAPVGQAIERVKLLLFRPFDLGRWFVIGFCAWLAQLGEAGGFHGNFGSGSHHHGGTFHQEFNQARHYVLENLYWILPVAAALVVLGLGLWILLAWLNSRGKFMFLYCVALDRAEVTDPWQRFARQGNSLFWFRLVLGLGEGLLTLPLLILSGLLVFRMALRGRPEVTAILWVAGMVLALIALTILCALVWKFTVDFVVPTMFLRGKTCLAGWQELLGLLSARPGEFVLYVLFQILLSLVIGLLILGVVLLTCCIAGCLLALPYLGTVLLLPVLVFKRAYSLHYFAQYGPDYDVFPPPAPNPVPPPAPS